MNGGEPIVFRHFRAHLANGNRRFRRFPPRRCARRSRSAIDRLSSYYIDPSCHRQEPQAGFLELQPCPQVFRHRPEFEVSALLLILCSRICGYGNGKKAPWSPYSGRIVSHGQYITGAVKRNPIKTRKGEWFPPRPESIPLCSQWDLSREWIFRGMRSQPAN